MKEREKQYCSAIGYTSQPTLASHHPEYPANTGCAKWRARPVGKSHSLWKKEANAEVDADDTILVARD